MNDLQKKFEQRTQELADTNQELSRVSKEYKDFTNSTTVDKKAFNSQLEKLSAENERKRKEIEAKSTTIDKYGDIVKEMKEKIDAANKQIDSLKDINENIRKRN